MPKRLYDDAMYRFGTPQASWWEASVDDEALPFEALSSEEHCDVAIIGGGYTGLSTAFHLCRDHDLDVRVLEAGHIGWGASGRNGGFCCVGGESLGAERMADRYGLDEARAYFRSQVEAVELVRDLIADEGIDAETQGDDELAIACSPKGFERLTRYAEFQYSRLGLDTRMIRREEVRETRLDSPVQHGAAVMRPTFGLHPLRYVRGLASAAARRGARIHPRSEVVSWRRDGGAHVLETAAGGTLRANQVVLAANGFMPEHLHPGFAGRPLPMISGIVVTRPMTADELKLHGWQTDAPTFTALNLLNYFRVLPDRRLMFGGRGSASGEEQSADRNFRRLIARLHELFPRWRHVDIEYRWHGLICMTRRLTPSIGRLEEDPSVFFGFGYHGNGVNTATWAGRQIARWIGTSPPSAATTADWLPGVVRGMTDRFPLARMRLGYIQAAIAAYRLQDRFS